MRGSNPKGKRKNKKGFLSGDPWDELLALGVLAAAVFLFLVLLPTSFLGEPGESWFPSGNVMGAIGGGVQAVIHYLFGVGSVLLPGLLTVVGLRLGGWLPRNWSLRVASLLGGLLLLLPPGLYVLFPASSVPGLLGSWLGAFLVLGLGNFGAVFLLAALTLLLLVGTLGWNPLLPVGRGAVQGAGFLGKGARRAGTEMKGWLQEWADAWKARASARLETMEAAEESDLFSFIDETGTGGGPRRRGAGDPGGAGGNGQGQ